MEFTWKLLVFWKCERRTSWHFGININTIQLLWSLNAFAKILFFWGGGAASASLKATTFASAAVDLEEKMQNWIITEYWYSMIYGATVNPSRFVSGNVCPFMIMQDKLRQNTLYI